MSIIKQIQKRRQQLDELSRKTLSSYVHKATAKLVDKAHDLGRSVENPSIDYGKAMRGTFNKSEGIKKAAKRLAKEDVEQVDEMSNDKLKDYAKAARADRDKAASRAADSTTALGKHDPKKLVAAVKHVMKRNKGLSMAVSAGQRNRSKAQYEEVEPLEELSRNTIKSYVAKGLASKKHHEGKAIKADDHLFVHHSMKKFGTTPSEDKAASKATVIMHHHDKIAKKRERGVDKAADKLSMRVPKKDGVMSEEIRGLLEDGIKKRGRPRKARHEDGKIVNDPKA